jgi:hypothetical protein
MNGHMITQLRMISRNIRQPIRQAASWAVLTGRRENVLNKSASVIRCPQGENERKGRRENRMKKQNPPMLHCGLAFLRAEFGRICDVQVVDFGSSCGFFEHFAVKIIARIFGSA